MKKQNKASLSRVGNLNLSKNTVGHTLIFPFQNILKTFNTKMIFREYFLEVGETVQWLESLTAFPDDLSSILCTHISPQMPINPFPRDPVFSSDLHRHPST